MEEDKKEEEKKEEEEKEEEDRSRVWKKFTQKELEHQYSPSRWSRRHVDEEVISRHVEEARWRSEEARRTVPCRLDEQYAPGGPRALADVYGEDLPRGAPLLVYVHGGYWQELEKSVSAYLVPPLYSTGVVVVVVGYDLAPQVGVADIVGEVRAAVVWACELARGRGSVGVVLAGWSAGGHLVTQVLSEEEKEAQDQEQDQSRTKQANTSLTPYRELIKGVVTLSGVFDLRPLVHTYVNDPLKLTKDSAWKLSPLRCVGTLAGRQSKEYCEACSNNGLMSHFVLVDGADHFSLVCDLFLDQYSLTSRLLTFIDTCCGRRKD
ncbi:hypothetical protein O3P69_019443 [Scylla paramamosain]|uniref:Alpha/beta hydrolase fold-3 domain-containing protein n=1 Tax=Scylla paramamosain TaxID=85552 RepID=A0AAW0SX34_SCYPA